MSTLNKYRKVPKELEKSEENTILVKSTSCINMHRYIVYIFRLLLEKKLDKLIIFKDQVQQYEKLSV